MRAGAAATDTCTGPQARRKRRRPMRPNTPGVGRKHRHACVAPARTAADWLLVEPKAAVWSAYLAVKCAAGLAAPLEVGLLALRLSEYCICTPHEKKVASWRLELTTTNTIIDAMDEGGGGGGGV